MSRAVKVLIFSGLVLSLMAACILPVVPVITATPLPPTETSLPPTHTPPPVPVQGLSQIQMIDTLNGWAWAAQANGTAILLRTMDGGRTWTDVTPTNLPNPSAGFFLDSQTTWVLSYDASSYANGLGLTTDGGKTWTTINQDLPFASAFFHFDTKADGWAEAYDVGAGQATIGFYATHDGGVNWNQVLLSSPPEDMLPGFLHTCNICGDAVYYDPTRLIIVPGDMATEPSGSVRLSISSDLGMTWKKIVLPFPSSKYADGLVSPGDPVFFDAQSGLLPVVIVKFNSDGSKAYSDLAVYITHDGGLTWKNSPAVVEDVGWMGRIDFASSDDAFVACGNNLCVSHDGTASWQTVTSNLNFSDNGRTDYVWRFDFVSASLGWAISTDGTNYSLWKTADSGQTWTNLSPAMHP